MKNKDDQKQAKKGFFARIIDKLDKKMQEKAKSASCCSGQKNKGKNSCCS
jgi:hypothetical protein